MRHRDRKDSPPSAQAAGGQPASETGDSGTPEIISHAEMNAARAQGLAVPLGAVIGYILRYDDSWWIPFEGGWIRADPALAAMLDAEAERMTAQDAIIARNAAIRAAISTAEPPVAAPQDQDTR